ncbi:MAG: phosphoenolpyruvate carboxykinase, partial [Candidatus Pacearchaeota archaeon]|nr:phosphoenolpyruvate carboxykinase [Candidatus Pacearchaeota archaeon]
MTNNQKLKDWVKEITEMCQPDKVVWCDGSKEEYDEMIRISLEGGYATKLNEEKRPGSVSFNSDVSDVARVEKRTYIASKK